MTSHLDRAMLQMAMELAKKIQDFKNRSHELEAVHTSMQEGVIAIEFESHPLSTLLNGAVYFCQPQAVQKNIHITLDCSDTLTVRVDPILMEQAIINLVDNAVKYSPEDTRVIINAIYQRDVVTIEIRDSGNGIDKEHLPKIFNRFYRVDKGRSRNEGGTGLGLAIVKHIVQYHGGKIEVESQRGKGTFFKISLPV